jgi:hypothetical protein
MMSDHTMATIQAVALAVNVAAWATLLALSIYRIC